MGRMGVADEVQTNRLGMPKLRDLGRMFLTFGLVVFGMLIFRCTTIGQFSHELGTLRHGLFTLPDIGAAVNWLFVAAMLVVEWLHRRRDHGLDIANMRSKPLRWGVYLLLVLIIFLNGGETTAFIYQVF